jgi:hypothetical protein
MADITDVQNALLSEIASVLFPTGYLYGAATTSLIGPTIRLYAGWPQPQQFDADLKAGIAHVTIFTDAPMARNTTRYERVWASAPLVAPTLLATVSGQTVTISGTPSASQIAGIQIFHNAPAAYRCGPSDTTATVAASLAALLAYASPTVSGSVITFPSTVSVIAARTGADTTASIETRRQKQPFKVTVWAPTYQMRELISPVIDDALAYVRSFTLPDGTITDSPIYSGAFIDDVPQRAHEWRRDLKYSIEYATIKTVVSPPVLFPYVNVNGDATIPVINNPVLPNVDYNIYAEDGVTPLGTSTGLPYTSESQTNI